MAKNNKDKEMKAPAVEENGANGQAAEADQGQLEAALFRVAELEDENAALKARLAELEGSSAAESAQNGLADPAAVDADLAAAAYDLFRQRQAEGAFPAWAELPEQTQKLWRASYAYVADGGAPRTAYEEAVKYLITTAE
jgi:hypothetical protein